MRIGVGYALHREVAKAVCAASFALAAKEKEQE
jgi:hypothetical protein